MRMVLAHKINFCVRMVSLTEQEWRVLLHKIARRLGLTEQEWRVLLHKIARRLVNVTDRKMTKMVLVFTFTTAFHLRCLLFRVEVETKRSF